MNTPVGNPALSYRAYRWVVEHLSEATDEALDDARARYPLNAQEEGLIGELARRGDAEAADEIDRRAQKFAD